MTKKVIVSLKNIELNLPVKSTKPSYSIKDFASAFTGGIIKDKEKNTYIRALTDINLQILKLFSYPVYLVLMSIFSSLIMLNIKNINSSTFKISIGLFFSVVIYYLYNFFHVLGSTERIPLIISIAAPLLILTIINNLMLYRVNEK